MIPIRCATCGEASQIDEAWAGRWVGCPHCRRPTLAVAATDLTAPPPVAPPPPPPPAAPPTPSQVATATRGGLPSIKAMPATASAPIASKSAVQPAKRPPLTRAQRLAIRRRRHFVLALGGVVILLAAAYLLFSLNK